MDDHWSIATRLEGLFFPFKFLWTEFVWGIDFTWKLTWVDRLAIVFFVGSCVLKVESNGQLEVELNGATLLCSTKSIINYYINFRTVKCSVTLVQLPRFSVLIKSSLKLWFCFLPLLISPHWIFRSSWQEDVPLESKEAIYIVQKLYACKHFLFYLIPATENMSIILLKTADTSQTWKRSTDFVSMQNSEISKSNRQFFIWMSMIFEH